MTNRLLRFPWATPAFSVLCLVIFSFSGLQAQFNWTPPNPNTYGTGSDCASSIAEANVMPTVTSTIGATIVKSEFDTTNCSYLPTDLFAAPALNQPVCWYVEDNLGNFLYFTFSINFVDQTPPEMQNLPNSADTYASVLLVPLPPTVTATDNCLGTININYVQTTPPDTCDAGTFTRTWTATDIAGNTSVFTQTITILADNAPPTITVFPQNGSAPCAQIPTAYPAWLAQQMANFTATDVSGIKSYSNNAPMPFPPGCAMPLTVVFSATDNCNHTKTTTAVFSTSDTQGPVVTVAPKDTVAYCAPNGNHLNKLSEWIHQRGFLQATDACSPSSSFSYIMQVNGMTRDSAGVVADFLASFANGCGTKLIGSQTYNKVRGSVKVDFFVKDICNNITFAGQATYGAIDTLPPVISGSNALEQCGGANDQANLLAWINAHGNATATDECSSTTWTNFSYTTSDSQNGNGVFNGGPYPSVQSFNCNWWADVTFRATDDCGNTGSKTLRFQIQDTQKPVISGFPDTVTISCSNPIPTLSPAFVSDNCDSNTVISYTFTTSNTLCPGSYTMHVTWSATDDCNNTGTSTQTVLVRDTEGPIFTLVPPADTFRCDTFVLPPFPVMGIGIMATDNCSQAMSITSQDASQQDPDPANCGHYTYNIIRTFTATDACGNTRTTTQVISVIDNLGPAPGGLLDTTMACEAIPFTTPPPSPVDACSGATATPTFVNDIVTNGPCDDTYTLTRNWQAQDVCGNTSIIPQIIHVVDTVKPVLTNIPPDVTVECDAIPAPPDVISFNATDNCDESVTITLNEFEIRNPDLDACDHWTNYLIRREWTATDNCGNTRTYTQFISVQDNTGPILVSVPVVSLPAEQGLCGATAGIPAPISLYDVCTSLKNNVILKDTALLVNTSGGPNNTTPVDTIVFQWPSPNMPPSAPALDPVTLQVYLDIADSESPTEYFRIYGEDGYLIGQTNPNNPPVQCGNSATTLSIPADKLNEWLTDGQLTLILAPNGTGSDAINALAVCSGARARAEISYEVASPQVPILLTFSLDGDTAEVFPPLNSFFLDVGTHTVLYTATDCAGNSTTATTTIEVADLQPPAITPPAPDTFFVGQNNCEAVVTLPFPAISDNCDFSGHLVQASASLPVIFENDPNAGWIPKDITLSLSGLVPNAIGPGLLGIRHKGDNDNAPGGEFFRIFDENNNFFSITSSGATAEQCSLFHETVITVPANTINGWAAGNFTTSFKLEANDDAGNFADFIVPCDVLLPDFTDGISRVQAVLEYSYAVVTYEIRNNTNQLVSFGSLIGNQTTDTLPPGVYTVKYLTTDVNGVEGSATFPITVLDTVRPQAICQSLTIQVNPSGLPGDTYVLQTSEVNNGSFDNCSGMNLNFQLSQTNFTCSQAGNNYNVTLTVTDASGNSSTCSAIVSVITTVLQPSYDAVCEGGTLHLYANPPGSASSYNWSGPNGFSSNLQNPTRPAIAINEGTYCVTVTGLTGCTATGCVSVDFSVLPTQPAISANKTSFCSGENIVLATPTYPGQNVTYQWFQNATPNPILLGTTIQPIFTITNPPAGTYSYFVKVTVDSCASSNSNLLTVTVYALPPATVSPSLIDICECQPLTLTSTTPPLPGLTYMWMGPAGFNSPLQSPLVTNCAIPSIHAGVYTLITKQNGCSSLPATVNVTIRNKPATPLLTGATQVCEGSTVTLICSNEPNAFAYEWLSPTLDTVTTSINSIVLNNVMVADSGSWRVRVLKQGCYSDWSAPILVEVQEYPNVTAGANTPLCQGATLQLTATSDVLIPPNNWSWTGPGGWSIFQQNPTRNPAVAGQYRVIGKTSFGCADTAFVTVDVKTPPIIASVTHTAPICADGSNAVLQAVVISDNPPLTYSWTGPMNFSSSDPMPVIPGITAAKNGTYNLVVTDNFGCSSVVGSTTINVKDPPVTPTLTATPPIVCAGADVTVSISDPSPFTNPLYTWYTPTGDTVTTQPFIIIPNAKVQDAGNYYVIVAVNGCVSDTSAPASLVVNPIPSTPVVTANTPLCEGETLNLSTQLVFNATYQWSGPAGTIFIPSANVRNPVVQNVTTSNSGNYSVTVTLNGCSNTGEGIIVTVKPRPKKPELIQPQAVCLEQAGSVLTLQITPQSAEPGAMYTWFYQGNMDTIGGPGFSISFQTSDFSNFSPGLNGFYVVANKDGCNSLASSVKLVQFDTIPNNVPFPSVVSDACASLPLPLSAANPAPATGHWTQVTAFPGTIVNPNSPATQVTGIVPGAIYQFAWTLSNGGCKNYASDTISITTFAPETAFVEDEVIVVCYTTSVQLHAIQGQSIDGYWTQDLGQQIFHITIADSLDPHTWVDSLIPGNTYYFYWNLDNGACGISSKRVTVVNYGSKPIGSIADQVLCTNDSCTTLIAPTLPTNETGIWYSDDTTLVFSTATSNETSVCNLKHGANKIIWRTNGGFCGPESYDTVMVVYELKPTAVPDNYDVDFGTTLNFNVLQNDILPQQYNITVEPPGPMHGELNSVGTGQFTYRPDVTFSGIDQMVYKICNIACPVQACSTATVTFRVGSVDDCEIFNVITPNDDGANDFFYVPCLDFGEIPDNEVTIFNQYGDMVYHAKPYDNNNPWRGQYKGSDLPVGTYFYIVKLNSQGEPKTGFLQLQR